MITAQQLYDKIIELGQKYPNAEYSTPGGKENCSYSNRFPANGPSSPGCIVGQALRELEPDLLDAIINSDKVSDTGTIMDETPWSKLCITMDWPELNDPRICKIQDFQDLGYKWGQAIVL